MKLVFRKTFFDITRFRFNENKKHLHIKSKFIDKKIPFKINIQVSCNKESWVGIFKSVFGYRYGCLNLYEKISEYLKTDFLFTSMKLHQIIFVKEDDVIFIVSTTNNSNSSVHIIRFLVEHKRILNLYKIKNYTFDHFDFLSIILKPKHISIFLNRVLKPMNMIRIRVENIK